MKNIVFLIFTLLLFNTSFAQYFRITNDTTLMKSELILDNSTKTKAGSFIRNKGNGRTEFAYAVDSIYSSHDTMFVRRGDGLSFVKIPPGYSDVAARAANANLFPSLNIGYVNPPWIASLPASKITGLPPLEGINTTGTVAQLRAMTTTTGQIYTSTDRGGGTWLDEGLNDGVQSDDGAIYIMTSNGHRLHRQINGDVYPEWWGAVANDGVSDTAAFGKMTRYCLYNNKNIVLNAGTYNFNGPWVVPGRPLDATGVNIKGQGGRETILKFANLSVKRAFQYGSTTSNTLHGDVGNFGIYADSSIDGLTVSSYAPTSNAFNRFHDIYMFRVKKGITTESNPSNTSSNYQNFFDNIMVEEYWSDGIFDDGAMNVFRGGFIVAPYGNHAIIRAGTGANSTAVHTFGGGASLDNIPTEDQWVLDGTNTKVTRSTIEQMKKAVPNTALAGNAAVKIGGGGVSIDGFTLTTLSNTVIGQMMAPYGTNTSLKNVVYLNPGNESQFQITYPILPSPGSSGTMENIDVVTTYPVNHPSFVANIADWSFINVKGLGDTAYARIKNLKIDEADALSLHLTGGTVSGNTTFNSILESPQLKATSLFFDESVHKIINSSSTDYINFVTIPTLGKRSLQNVEDINGNTATFNTGILAGSANITGVANTGTLNSAFTILSGPTYHRASTYLDPSHGDTLATAVIVPDTVTYARGVINLPNAGFARFFGNVSGAPAVADTQYLTLGQSKAQLQAKFDSSRFAVGNAPGTGDTLFVANSDTLKAKTISVQGVGVSKSITASSVTYTVPTITTGLAQLSGNGSSTSFDIVLAITPSWVGASNPANAASVGISYTEPIANGLRIHFTTAPPSGTNNIQFYYSYK